MRLALLALVAARYLREPATQELIATFGKGKYDELPLFFPVARN